MPKKEFPILFTGEMVRAILDGTKTQTRRLVDMRRLRVVPRTDVGPDIGVHQLGGPEVKLLARKGRRIRASLNRLGAVSASLPEGLLGLRPGEFDFVCPYAQGETSLVFVRRYAYREHEWTIHARESRLWVRETWRTMRPCPIHDAVGMGEGIPAFVEGCTCSYDPAEYRATDGRNDRKWKPSIHMPRWASRLTPEPIRVRLQHLQDITEDDAKAEGVVPMNGFAPDQPILGDCKCRTNGSHPYTMAFAVLWDEINGNRAPFRSDPWVWAVEFRR